MEGRGRTMPAQMRSRACPWGGVRCAERGQNGYPGGIPSLREEHWEGSGSPALSSHSTTRESSSWFQEQERSEFSSAWETVSTGQQMCILTFASVVVQKKWWNYVLHS